MITYMNTTLYSVPVTKAYLQFFYCEGATMWRPFPRGVGGSCSSLHSSSARCWKLSLFSSNYSSHAPSLSRWREQESCNMKVSVWWDFENCHLPVGVNAFKVAPRIKAALSANAIKGPVEIKAVGDVSQLSRTNQEALSSTGINLNHIPNGGKNSADAALVFNLMYWVSQNPPPAHLFLISGDGGFARILHRLRGNKYNILLASIDSVPDVLCSAASIMWQWNSLVRGEKLIGKYFNYPPDGLYGSWYGHFKGRIEDPFSTSKQSKSMNTEEVPNSTQDSKVRSIPKSILKQIKFILRSHPKGISLGYLRSELVKVDGNLDKGYYGYGKFSRFLLSLSTILEIQTRVGGDSIVRSVSHKVPDLFEPTAIPSILSYEYNRVEENISPPKLGDETESTDTKCDAKVNSNFEKQTKELLNEPRQPIIQESLTKASTYRKTSVSQNLETRAGDLSHKAEFLHLPNEKVEVAIVQEIESPSLKTEKTMLTGENQIPKIEVGFFKMMWKKLFPKYHFSETKMDKVENGAAEINDVNNKVSKIVGGNDKVEEQGGQLRFLSLSFNKESQEGNVVSQGDEATPKESKRQDPQDTEKILGKGETNEPLKQQETDNGKSSRQCGKDKDVPLETREALGKSGSVEPVELVHLQNVILHRKLRKLIYKKDVEKAGNSDKDNSGHAFASADNEVSESWRKVENSDSRWEKLRPISNTSSSRSGEESRYAFGLLGVSKEPDCEPAQSEDDSSDAETASPTRSEGQRQFKSKNKTFSLLEVFDSRHNQKKGDNSKTQSKDVDRTLDLLSAAYTGPFAATSYRQKLRPQKGYTSI